MNSIRLAVAAVSILAVSACATTPERQLASQSSAVQLTKICKSSPGAKWELYNTSGLFRDEADEIHFFGVNGAGPHIIKREDKDFSMRYSSLKEVIFSNQLECVGVEKIDAAVLSDLKANVDNFGQSSCKESKYSNTINSAVNHLPKSTVQDANQFDILSDAIDSIKDGSLRTSQDLCRQAVTKVKKKLNALSSKEGVGNTQKNPTAKGTR